MSVHESRKADPQKVALFRKTMEGAGVSERLPDDISFGDQAGALKAQTLDRDGNTTTFTIRRDGAIFKTLFCSTAGGQKGCRDIREDQAVRIGSLNPHKVDDLRKALLGGRKD